MYHGGYLLRANRTIRAKCLGSELFKSPNYPVLASTVNQDVTIYWDNIRDFSYHPTWNTNKLELIEVISTLTYRIMIQISSR